MIIGIQVVSEPWSFDREEIDKGRNGSQSPFHIAVASLEINPVSLMQKIGTALREKIFCIRGSAVLATEIRTQGKNFGFCSFRPVSEFKRRVLVFVNASIELYTASRPSHVAVLVSSVPRKLMNAIRDPKSESRRVNGCWNVVATIVVDNRRTRRWED